MGKFQFRSILAYGIVFVITTCHLLPTSQGWVYRSNNVQPGLEFKPDSLGSTLIWFNSRNYQTYVDSLNDFLRVYKSPKESGNITQCSYDNPSQKGQFCEVDLQQFGMCTEQYSYGYDTGSPCVFLKIKNIPNWVPQYYNDTMDLPRSMPEELKKHILTQGHLNNKYLNTIWVTCDGENPVDMESIGPLSYYPRRGFAGYYFPMENEEPYLNPLIAIRFERPQIGIAIFIECRMWARNIVYDRDRLLGLVQFQLLVD